MKEMQEILAIRAATEQLEVEHAALERLSHIAARTSLRYAVQMLTPAHIMASTVGRSVIAVADDVEEVDDLFWMPKRAH